MPIELLLAFKIMLLVFANTLLIWGIFKIVDEETNVALPTLVVDIYKGCGVLCVIAIALLAMTFLSYWIWQINVKTV